MTTDASTVSGAAVERHLPPIDIDLDALLLGWQDGDGRGWHEEFCWLEAHHMPALDMLLTSIQENGIREPILLGDDRRVWDGHHRIYAASKLGFETVPVMFSQHAAAGPTWITEVEPTGDEYEWQRARMEALYERIADRLGEHDAARNVSEGPSEEQVTILMEPWPVEDLARFIVDDLDYGFIAPIRRLAGLTAEATREALPSAPCRACGPGYRIGDDVCRHDPYQPDEGELGVCRTCAQPIWWESGTVGHRERIGWSDRNERGGDSVVCFKAVDYRHVPMGSREAAIYRAGVKAGRAEAQENPEGSETT